MASSDLPCDDSPGLLVSRYDADFKDGVDKSSCCTPTAGARSMPSMLDASGLSMDGSSVVCLLLSCSVDSVGTCCCRFTSTSRGNDVG